MTVEERSVDRRNTPLPSLLHFFCTVTHADTTITTITPPLSFSLSVHNLHQNLTHPLLSLLFFQQVRYFVSTIKKKKKKTLPRRVFFKWPILTAADEDLRRLHPPAAPIPAGHCSPLSGLRSPTAPEGQPPPSPNSGQPP